MARPNPSRWQRELAAETPELPARPAAPPDRARAPCLSVLAHPDPEWVGARAVLRALSAGREVLLSRLEPDFLVAGDGPPRPLADPFVSRQPLRLEPLGKGGIRLVRGSSKTSLIVDGEGVGRQRDLDPTTIERGAVLLLAQRIVLLLHTTSAAPRPQVQRFGLVGDSSAMVQLRQEISRVADAAIPILLRGETGTGKELAARAIHRAGRRHQAPCLAVNMAAIPPQLAAAELFGAAKGAFTGAEQKTPGYFRRARGGTLFLDEIGETSPDVQAMILRALDSGEVQPVGGSEPVRVDVRVLAATDADLEQAVADGRFRAPLLHRLSGYELYLPPLRRRREDLGQLLLHFLRRELSAWGREDLLDATAPGTEPWLDAAVVARLAAYDWPGNVRQLKHAAQQLVVSNRSASRVTLPPPIERLLAELPEWPLHEPVARRPHEISEDELIAALAAQRWQIKAAARQLGISRASLYQRIERCPRIRKATDLERPEIENCLGRHGGDLEAAAAELQVSEQGLRQRMRALGLL